MRRIVLAIGGAGVLAALVAGIRRRSREAAAPSPLLVSESMVIERPPEEVFGYIADPANLPEWSGPAIEVRDIQHASPGTLGEGDTFTPVLQFLGRRIVEHVEVTVFEPNRRILHRATGGPMPLVISYIFEEVPNGGTLLTIGAHAQPEGFFKLVGPVSLAAVRRQIKKYLQNLKELLELRRS